MIDNMAPDDFVNIHILYKNFPDNAMQTIVDMTNQHVKIIPGMFNDEDMAFMQQFTNNSPNSAVRSWSGIVFARLWIPMYLKSLDRCIYLDSDTIVRGSLKELWQTDLQGKAYGMAMGSVPEYGHNSGVMLMDCRKIDNEENWKGLFEHMQAYATTYMLPDQTVINRYYRDEIFELPQKFNYGPRTDTTTTEQCRDALIWHFYNGGTKPS
jgi:lipopolysaccharide biosynthesis glycosyltransferase